MPRYPRPLLVVRLVFLVALAGVALVAVGTPAPVHGQEPDRQAWALLDGVPLLPGEAAEVNARLPVAVMVDNLRGGARPQIGLDRADLVYELLVEAGITRFLAVYLRRDAEWVEPVRSVRIPYLYLVKELGAVLAHVGAAESPEEADAGSRLRDWNVRHVDAEKTPAPFWRDRRRPAPHNVVTSTAAVRAEAEAQGMRGPSVLDPWRFKDDLLGYNALGGFAVRIAFGFAWGGPPQPAYAVEWVYDHSFNGYRRSMGGRPHTDGHTGAQLTAKNVVVQFDRIAVVSSQGHVNYGSIGEGPAYVFLDGHVIEATWTKRDLDDRTRYWDAEGKEIIFNRGTTWVAILPYGSPLSWE